MALTRKNALFAGHDEGGKAWGRIASLIETAKINNVEPFAYLKATLEAIAAGHPQHRIDELLPWNFQPSSYNPGAFQTPLTKEYLQPKSIWLAEPQAVSNPLIRLQSGQERIQDQIVGSAQP